MAVARKSGEKGKPVRRADTAARNAQAPLSNAYFRVLIGDEEIGLCQISRLQACDALPPVSTGRPPANRPAQPRPDAPVDPRPSSVTLRRAITRSKQLYEWRQAAAAGKRDLRTVIVHQCDATGAIVNTFALHGCRPLKWSGPEFNALANDIAMEELEICCERIEWV